MTFTTRNTKASRLTAEKVIEIRRKYEYEGCTQASLSREFQVTVGTIHNIVTGVTWQHIGTPFERARQKLVEVDAGDSAARLIARLSAAEPVAAMPPSLYDSPPPTEAEDQAVAERAMDRLNDELKPTAKQQELRDELDKLKGD